MSAGAIPVTGRGAGMLTLAAVAGLGIFLWPLAVPPTSSMPPALGPILFAAVLPLVLGVVLAELTSGGMDAKALALLGVLCAVGAVLRPLGTGTAGMEAVFFVLIVGGRVLGPGFGFAQGAITLFASALLTGGVGPWLPYQMLGAALVGLGAGLLPRTDGWRELVLLGGYGFVSAFAYGWLLDFAFWPFALGNTSSIGFDPAAGALANLHRFVLFNLATSMGWNLGRALTNVALVVVAGPGVLLVLRRAARRASFTQPRTRQRAA